MKVDVTIRRPGRRRAAVRAYETLAEAYSAMRAEGIPLATFDVHQLPGFMLECRRQHRPLVLTATDGTVVEIQADRAQRRDEDEYFVTRWHWAPGLGRAA